MNSISLKKKLRLSFEVNLIDNKIDFNDTLYPSNYNFNLLNVTISYSSHIRNF